MSASSLGEVANHCVYNHCELSQELSLFSKEMLLISFSQKISLVIVDLFLEAMSDRYAAPIR